MKKMWFLITGLVLGASVHSPADTFKAEAAPKVEESTSDADKAAVKEAATDADHWAAKHPKETERRSEEAKESAPPSSLPPSVPVSSSPAAASSAAPMSPPPAPVPAPPVAPPAPKKESVKPAAPRSGLNEMKGKLQSKSSDPRTLRVLVDGGYNVEFSFDSKTAFINGGSTITIDDLEYNDEIVVHYAGKELYAIDIDRVHKAQP